MSETGAYLFCFARTSVPLDLVAQALAGDDLTAASPTRETQPLLLEECRGVAAVYRSVDLSEFRGPDAEVHLNDLAWVGPRVLRHQQTVESVMRYSPVLPCRFATLFSSPAVLLQRLQALRPLIAAFLDYIADKEEWAVKGTLHPAQAEAWLRATDPALVERSQQLAAAPGRRYFQEKQLLTEVRKQLRLWVRDRTAHWQEALTAGAVADGPLRLTAANEPDRQVIFNRALLLVRERVAELRAAVARLNAVGADRGLQVELSGPWPPYSFSPSLAPNPEPVDEVARLLHPSG